MDTTKNKTKVNLTKKEVGALIDSYNELKEKSLSIEKELKPINEKIKDYMLKHKVDTLDGTECSVCLSESKKVNYIEFLLIEKLKKLGREDLIKTKEYVDINALERELYNDSIDVNEIQGCTQELTTYRLTIKKDKK